MRRSALSLSPFEIWCFLIASDGNPERFLKSHTWCKSQRRASGNRPYATAAGRSGARATWRSTLVGDFHVVHNALQA